MQLSRADGVAGVLTLSHVVVRVRLVVILHPDQEEGGRGGQQREPPQGNYDVLHSAFGHYYFAPKREANG